MRIKKHFPAAAFFAAVQKQNIVTYGKRFFIMPVSKNGKISDKISVGFFFGGKSVEHEVSVITGLQAMYAADTEKYRTVIAVLNSKFFPHIKIVLLWHNISVTIKNYILTSRLCSFNHIINIFLILFLC